MNINRALLAIVSAAGLTGCCSVFGVCTDIDDIVTYDMHYIPVAPPATLWKPGTIITLTSATPLVPQIVCNSTDVIGDKQLQSSPTVTQEWQTSTKGDVTLSADNVANLNAKLGGNYVSTVNLSFTEASVVNIADADVTQAVLDNKVTTACLNAIKARTNANQPLTMLSSSLTASVKYQISFQTGVTATAALANQVSDALSADLSVSGTNSLSGTGLVFGVLDDATLVQEAVSKSVSRDASLAASAQALSRQVQALGKQLTPATATLRLNLKPQ